MKPAAGADAQAAGQVHSKFTQALALHQSGQLAQAQALYQQVLQVQPQHFDALHFLGVLARQSGHLKQAVALIGRSIALQPHNAAALSNRGNALIELAQYEAALLDYERAIALQPEHAEAYSNRGVALTRLKQYPQALASLGQAIALRPDFAQAYGNRGNTLNDLKQHQAALNDFNTALALQPDNADAFCGRGNALHALKQYQAAVESFRQAIALKPDYADAYCNQGNALHALKQHQAAIESYRQAIALKPDHADAYCNCGNTLRDLKRQLQAIDHYDKAIALRPNYAEAYSNRGIALNDLKRHDEAISSYDKAIDLRPDFAQAYSNRGNAFNALKQHPQAIANYEQALSLEPNYEYLLGSLLHTRRQICDWRDAASTVPQLLAAIERGEKMAPSFPVLALTDSPALQRKAAEIWAAEKHASHVEPTSIPKRSKTQKIRVGYFSMDFREHPVSFLAAQLFELHNRDHFEVYAFSYGPDTRDAMRLRLEAAFDKFIDVSGSSEREIAELARQIKIDIAVDLAGYTGSSRSGLFAWRAAPVQVNYLGYPGTLGAPYMDYLIADRQVIPKSARQHYTEKVVYLPDTYMVSDATRRISDRTFTREELGLPPEGFVFCCFNNSYKISPSTFDGWMRVLKQVAGSVLWLSVGNPVAVDNLRKEAELRGVSANRLVFAPKLPLLDDHLARQRAADLFLDTLPYNAHTTASDALWAGLPVLTCVGEAFASRVASSLLSAIELPELITTTHEEYEALAVALALNPKRLKAIRQKLEHNRLSTPLFDTQRFARHLEDAYSQMLEHYHAGLPPEHIEVAHSGGARAAQTLPGDGNQTAAQVQAKFMQGLALQKQGKLSQAKALYQQVLEAQPRHSDALHVLGVMARQTGNLPQAVELLSQSIEISPENAATHALLGNVLNDLGQYEAAIRSYDQAITLKPDQPEAYANRGVALTRSGQYQAAIDSFCQAIALKPKYAQACCSRGNAHSHLKQYQDAIASYDQAIAIQPDYAEAYLGRGCALVELKQHEEAVTSYEQAIKLKPEFAQAYFNRGVALYRLKRYQLALNSFDQTLALKPDFADARAYRGVALHNLGLYQAALDSYDQALDLDPTLANARWFRGNTLKELRQHQAAIDSYKQAIELKPDAVQAHWNLGLCYLQMGEFALGWQEYEWRWQHFHGKPWQECVAFPQPEWSGAASLQGKTLLLHSEQGLGDTIQFCRYVKLLGEAGTRVVLKVQRPLVTLLASLDGVAEIVALGDPLPPFDYHCPLLSLPRAFKTDLDSIPWFNNYLDADPRKVEAWSAKLGAKTKLRIGLVWRGNPEHANDGKRSISLADIVRLLPKGFQYLSLQKDIADEDQETLTAHSDIMHFGEELHDFSDTAALCKLVDVVVSVDTSVAHLAGALGKPVWLLLDFNSDWRWLLDRVDSPWYPTAKLYRQVSPGGWDDVFQRVKADLQAL